MSYRKIKDQRGSIISEYSKKDSLSQIEKCLLDVEFLDGSKQEILIDSQCRCLQICAEIAMKINLKSYLDFRISLRDSKGNLRILDNEELLFKIIFPNKNSLHNNALLT